MSPSTRFCVRMDLATIEKAETEAKAAGTTLHHLLRECIKAVAAGRTERQALGAKGGEARAEALTPEERSNIARKAAEARWKGKP